jgi:peroxiredoxin
MMVTKQRRQRTGQLDAPAKARRRRAPLLAIAGVAALLLLAATALVPHGSPATALACAGKDAKTGLAVGQCAPDFTLSNLQGRPVSLASFRGRPVLLHFWAVGCTTCKAEYPDFSRAVRTYTVKGLAVVAVDAWGESTPMVQGWQDAHHLAATLLVDTSQAVPSMYNGTTTPTTYVIDRDGRVTFSQTGPLSYNDFQRHISSIM